MIIGISGKKQSGKNLIGNIIQILTAKDTSIDILSKLYDYSSIKGYHNSDWEQKSFAHLIKVFVAQIIDCSLEDLENEDFKNKPLGEDWVRYAYATGSETVDGETFMCSTTCTKEVYEEQKRINHQTAYKLEHTPRTLLQMIGTNVGRLVHRDYWVNALMSKYKTFNENCTTRSIVAGNIGQDDKPNWIITDVRFPNEVKAIEDREGFIIRVIRDSQLKDTHKSETALNKYNFKYTINNNGTIDELIERVKEVLIKENII